MQLIEVSPAEGRAVKHPESGNPIRPGQKVHKSPAIRRMIKHGDLIEKVAKKKTEKKEAK